jgi:dihydrofolate reductase
MRELKYYVACTIDRLIARRDGSFDFFLGAGPHLDDIVRRFPETIPGHLHAALGVRPQRSWCDAVLMGRKTYEVGIPLGVTSPYAHLEQYVFSRTMSGRPDAGVELVTGDPLAAVRELKQRSGRDIWLCGGAALASALLPEIDQIILKVNPIVLGDGIPLFAGPTEPVSFALVHHAVYDNGFALMHYTRARRAPATGPPE